MLKTNTYLPYYCFEEDNWGAKLEGRYWNPSDNCQSLNICVIASVTKEVDWAAYIGAAPGVHTEREALKAVARIGAKLSEKDARYFFPEIKLPYRY